MKRLLSNAVGTMAVSALLIAVGCGDSYEVINPTIGSDVIVRDIYVGGGGNRGDSTTTVWKNGNPLFGNEGDFVNSVFVTDQGEVYAAGYNTESSQAILWKDGNPVITAANAQGNSVYVSGGTAYVAGINGGAPTLWTGNSSQPLPSSATGWTATAAKSVFVSGSSVYVAGHETETASGKYRAVLWVDGTPQVLDLPPGGWSNGEGYLANSVFVTNGKVYVAGTMYNDTVTANNAYKKYFAVVWENGIPRSLSFNNGLDTTGGYVDGQTGQLANATLSSANSIYVSGNDVYVAGFAWMGGTRITNTYDYPNDTQQAIFWKNDYVPQRHTSRSWGNSIFVSGSDFYVAGVEGGTTAAPADYGVLWVNGVRNNHFPVYAGTASRAAVINSVFVK